MASFFGQSRFPFADWPMVASGPGLLVFEVGVHYISSLLAIGKCFFFSCCFGSVHFLPGGGGAKQTTHMVCATIPRVVEIRRGYISYAPPMWPFYIVEAPGKRLVERFLAPNVHQRAEKD